VDAAWLLLLGLSLGGSVLWHGARRRPPRQTPTLTIALTVAALEAARRGHARVAPEHLVLAALFPIEHAAGKDLGSVRDAVEARLAETPSDPSGPMDPRAVQLSQALLGAIRRASFGAMREARALGLRDVLDEASSDPSVGELVDAAFDAPDPIPSAPESARIMGTPYRAPSDDRAEIVLWNDDVSTMEGVMDVLRECFAKSEAEALHLMLTTHMVGRAVVGRYAWDEAKARVLRATERARKAGMPLIVTFAAPGAAPAIKKTRLSDRVRRFFAKSA
jgi:ATP-dependent Clp protease adaptor protein ClpS